MVAVIAAVAAVTGTYETRRVPVGSAAIVLAGIAGCAAVLSRAGASVVDIVPTVVGAACGVAVLRLLTSGRFTDEPAGDPAADAPDAAGGCRWSTLGLLGSGRSLGWAVRCCRG